MTLLDARTSGTSRVLTVASLQRLKMEALIPVPADCEVRSVIKFLNVQRTAPIEIHRQLCQVYGQTRLDSQHISYTSSAGRCLIIHTIARTSHPSYFLLFLHLNKFLFGMRQRFQNNRGGDECHSCYNPRRQTSTTQGYKAGPTACLNYRRWICWKIAQHLLYLFQ